MTDFAMLKYLTPRHVELEYSNLTFNYFYACYIYLCTFITPHFTSFNENYQNIQVKFVF